MKQNLGLVQQVIDKKGIADGKVSTGWWESSSALEFLSFSLSIEPSHLCPVLLPQSLKIKRRKTSLAP